MALIWDGDGFAFICDWDGDGFALICDGDGFALICNGDGDGFFVCSWGSTWGDHGYIKIHRTDSTSGPGRCGIAMQASYPIAI